MLFFLGRMRCAYLLSINHPCVFKHTPKTTAAPTMDSHAQSIIQSISESIEDFEYHRRGCTSRLVLQWIFQSDRPAHMFNLIAVQLGVDKLATRVAYIIQRSINESAYLQHHDLSAIISRVNRATAPAA